MPSNSMCESYEQATQVSALYCPICRPIRRLADEERSYLVLLGLWSLTALHEAGDALLSFVCIL